MNPITAITAPMPPTAPETVPTVCIIATASFDFPAISPMPAKNPAETTGGARFFQRARVPRADVNMRGDAAVGTHSKEWR